MYVPDLVASFPSLCRYSLHTEAKKPALWLQHYNNILGSKMYTKRIFARQSCVYPPPRPHFCPSYIILLTRVFLFITKQQHGSSKCSTIEEGIWKQNVFAKIESCYMWNVITWTRLLLISFQARMWKDGQAHFPWTHPSCQENHQSVPAHFISSMKRLLVFS